MYICVHNDLFIMQYYNVIYEKIMKLDLMLLDCVLPKNVIKLVFCKISFIPSFICKLDLMVRRSYSGLIFFNLP